MDLFTSREMLGEHDMWYCPRCKEHKQAYKEMRIWKMPQHLVIHLKRFEYDTRFGQKLEHLVEFPFENFQPGRWSAQGAQEESQYDLYAVCNHSGGTLGGHYTAYCKHNDTWYNFNDNWVSPTSLSSIVSSEAYLLFYKLRPKT
eukprot:NODE_9100_length_620_cov_30.122736_g8472_i0.p1 GENE.NODE_9100_length_620_cov_30.122736_g8472_i0~~NODE_9100_length_620_cov_30.122736_g8472_i0.p1  ORF type:complete len:159 (-),score=23.76 NODE_9100_length_620_cov_30.122736_g8472_i0:142-573(-)